MFEKPKSSMVTPGERLMGVWVEFLTQLNLWDNKDCFNNPSNQDNNICNGDTKIYMENSHINYGDKKIIGSKTCNLNTLFEIKLHKFTWLLTLRLTLQYLQLYPHPWCSNLQLLQWICSIFVKRMQVFKQS